MAGLRDIHKESYADMPFDEFARKFHAKSYADMPFEQFMQRAAPEPILDINGTLGSDGVSGDSVRAGVAGNTRSQLSLPDIQSGYRMAQERGDRPEQRAMADAYVQREKRDGPVMMGASDRVRSAARGVPFLGEFLDEANAFSFDKKKREEGQDYQSARDASYDASNPYQSMAGKAVGGIAGTIAAAPIAGAGWAGSLLGLGAKTVPGAITRGMVAGGTQGLASGYGREGTIEGAVRDAAIGVGIGGTVPAALAAGKAGLGRVVDAITPSDALSSAPKKAQDFFVKQFGGKDAMNALQQKMDNIGPNAVLADVSPEMLGMAQGASARPGSRQSVVDALIARDGGKNARMRAATDNSLGKVVEPSAIKSSIKESKEVVGEQYGDVFRQNASAVRTQPIADSLDSLTVELRGPAQKAIKEVRGMLNIPGNTQALDPSPNALFQTRQAIDGLLKTEANPQTIRQLSQARQMIDDELSSAVPGVKAVDQRYSELAKQGNALDEGAQSFRTGPEAVRPSDMARSLADGAVSDVGPSAVPLRMAQGARAEVDRLMGANSNDVSALRNALKGEGDWNRGKLKMLFGEKKSTDFLKSLDAETAMEGTYKQVVGGSQTGVKNGFKEFIDEAADGVKIPEGASAFSVGARAAKNIVNKLTGANSEAKAEELAKALGDLSVAGGDKAKALIEALTRRQVRASNDVALNDAFARMGAGSARSDDATGTKAAIAAILMGRDYAREKGQAKQRQ